MTGSPIGTILTRIGRNRRIPSYWLFLRERPSRRLMYVLVGPAISSSPITGGLIRAGRATVAGAKAVSRPKSNGSLEMKALRRLLGRDPQLGLAIPPGLFAQADDMIE